MKFIHIICLSLALSASSLSATVSAQTGTGYFLHTVTKGQSLYSIASMYHVSVDDIVRLNPGKQGANACRQALKITAQYSNDLKTNHKDTGRRNIISADTEIPRNSPGYLQTIRDYAENSARMLLPGTG